MAKSVINSLNAGELSPYLYARSDLDKYSSGCLTMENFVPLPYGGATRRPAVEYKFASVGDDKVRLVPFTFSVDDTFLLVIGDAQINIYQDGVFKELVKASEGNGTVPWADTELADLKYCQSADVMWFVHPDHPVQRLTRTSDTSWAIAEETFDFPPLLDENEDEVYFDLTFSETAWTDAAYTAGDVRQYDGIVYKANIDHVASDSGGVFTKKSSAYGAWERGLWMADNEGTTAVLNAYDAKSGGSTTSVFTSDDVGKYISIRNNRNSSKTDVPGGINIAATTPYDWIFHSGSEFSTSLPSSLSTGTAYLATTYPINASFSNWEYTQEGTAWSGTITIQRSLDGGVTWEDYVLVTSQPDQISKSLSVTSDKEEGAWTWLRVKYDSFYFNAGGGGPGILSITDEQDITGIVRITGYNSPSSVDVEIIVPVQKELSTGISTGGTEVGSTVSTRSKQWAFSAFSEENGYPSSIAMFENRLTYAGTSGSPNRIWMSAVDDYQNFEMSEIDDAAMDLTINSGQIDEIRWLVPQERLVIGTAGSEWSLGASDERKAITPTGFDLKRKTSYGSNNVQALLVNSAVLFLMRQSRKAREWTPNYNLQDYVAPDLTILSEHITEDGISEWAYQQQPDNVLWCIRGDGTLVGFTYERDQNVTGWHRHVNTAFNFESVAVLPRDNEEDEVWVSVNMSGTRMIGRLNDREFDKTAYTSEWAGADLYVDYQSSGDALHLASKTVELVVDGVPKGTQTVTAGGDVTGATGTVNIVGLPFTSKVAPLYINADNQYGTSKGSKTDCRKATVRFKDTYSAKVGQTLNDLETVVFNEYDTALYTEDAETWFDNASEFLQTLYIVQEDPMPCTVLCVVAEQEVRR